MYKIVVFILLLLTILSCTRTIKSREEASDEEIVYTDSFSPRAYEYPMSRRVVTLEDPDLGIYYDTSTLDPYNRSVIAVVDNLIRSFADYNEKDVRGVMTESCFVSFNLRYAAKSFKGKYQLRVGVAENISQDQSRLKVKITADGVPHIGVLTFIKNGENYLINDFEYSIFDDLVK